jgi:hypothetical protein
MSEFKKEQRYVVVKVSDIDAAGCTQAERDGFSVLCDKVGMYRISAGKGPLECVVVESDWPEYEPTWAAIQRRAEGKAIPVIGAPFEGGFYGGEIIVNGERFALVVAPKAEGEKMELEYKLKDRSTSDETASDDDGFANSELINDSNHPAAHFCRQLQIGGFNDWYLPSCDELALLCRNLGPRRKNTPELFREDAAEAFNTEYYWSSTEHAPHSNLAWLVGFGSGGQYYYGKYTSFGVRAVRRLKI